MTTKAEIIEHVDYLKDAVANVAGVHPALEDSFDVLRHKVEALDSPIQTATPTEDPNLPLES